MAKLATCPGCTTQLALPEEATLSDVARCPRCGDEFPLMEAVQFSIPTAELIPASERSTSSEVVEWAATPLERKSLEVCKPVEETASVDESEIDEILSTPPEPADAKLSATLSDWEARLKRAISDTGPSEEADAYDDDYLEPLSPRIGSSTESTRPKDILEEFAFPHEDLEPQHTDPEPQPTATPWSAVEADEFDFDSDSDSDELTVNTTGDATVPNLVASPATELGINTSHTSTNSKSGKKKKPSLSRTMLSASLGVVGIPLGLYALLWIKGPEADVAHLANYLPQMILPSSMQTPVSTPEVDAESLALEDSDPLPVEEEQAMPPLVADPEVQPATAEVPAYSGPQFGLVDRAEFGQLLADATEAAPELTTGKLADEFGKKRKGHAYMTLCRLADKCSFMNQPGLTIEDADQVAAAQKLLETTFSSPAAVADLPLIVGPWWEFKSRPTSGILLAGHVGRVDATAAGWLAQIQVGDSGENIPVLFGGDPPSPGTQIGIVGSIVDNPSLAISALPTHSEPIVLAHFSHPLADPSLGSSLSGKPN